MHLLGESGTKGTERDAVKLLGVEKIGPRMEWSRGHPTGFLHGEGVEKGESSGLRASLSQGGTDVKSRERGEGRYLAFFQYGASQMEVEVKVGGVRKSP